MPSGDYNELYFLEQQSLADRQLSTMPQIIDTDPTLAGNSDARVPSQKAIKSYVDGRTSGRIVYTSQLGISLDGSVDEITAVQAVLDSSVAMGGLHFIHDTGTIKHSASLQIGSNTRFETRPGAQWKLADSSDTTQLRNKNPVGAGGDPIDHDIEIIGGFFDGNGANQGKYDTQAPSDGMGTGEGHQQWNYGIAFFGVRNLLIQRTNLINPRTFAFLLSNIRGRILIDSPSVEQTTTASFQDTLHFWGPLDPVEARNVRSINTGDDVIAANIGEAEGATHPWTSWGSCAQITVNGVNGNGRVLVRTLTGSGTLQRLVISDVNFDLTDADAAHAVGLDGTVDCADLSNWVIKGAGNIVLGGLAGFTGRKLTVANWQILNGTYGNNVSAFGYPKTWLLGPTSTNSLQDLVVSNVSMEFATTGGDFITCSPNTDPTLVNESRASLSNIALTNVSRLMVNTDATHDAVGAVALSNINAGALRALDGKWSHVTGDAVLENARRDNESLLRRAASAGGYNALAAGTDENWKRFLAFLYRKFGSQTVENFLDFRLGNGTLAPGLKSDGAVSGSAPTWSSTTGFTPADTQTVSYTSTLGLSSAGAPFTALVVAQRASDESHTRGLFYVGDATSGNNGIVAYQENGTANLHLATFSTGLVTASIGAVSHGGYFLALLRVATTHGISLNGGAFTTGTGPYAPTTSVVQVGNSGTGAQWDANIVCAGVIKSSFTDADAAAVYAEFKKFLGGGLSLP